MKIRRKNIHHFYVYPLLILQCPFKVKSNKWSKRSILQQATDANHEYC